MIGRISFFIFLLFLGNDIHSQNLEPINLTNPSFEGLPRASKTPRGWYDCGFPGETAPDIQPGSPLEPIFGNNLRPAHGNTYLGLVVRDNDTWEKVSQRLPQDRVLEEGMCYEMSIDLARAKNYVSLSRKTNVEANYSQPVKVRIYGSNKYCGKDELLAESGMVSNYNWKRYDFKFEPKANYDYIMIEAFYKTPALFLYNGNIMIDNISAIQPTLCKDREYEPLVKIVSPEVSGYKSKDIFYKVKADLDHIEKKSQIEFIVNGKKATRFSYDAKTRRFSSGVTLRRGANEIEIRVKNGAGEAVDKTRINYEDFAIAGIPTPYESPKPKPTDPFGKEEVEVIPDPVINTELADVTKMKEGQLLQIKDLYFKADSFGLNSTAIPVLNEIFNFMKKNKAVVIEVGGHTNNLCAEDFCKKLSEKRARSVVDYLIGRGIDQRRLSYKGYGSADPLVPNNTSQQRKKNQRVQLKIISMDG